MTLGALVKPLRLVGLLIKYYCGLFVHDGLALFIDVLKVAIATTIVTYVMMVHCVGTPLDLVGLLLLSDLERKLVDVCHVAGQEEVIVLAYIDLMLDKLTIVN